MAQAHDRPVSAISIAIAISIAGCADPVVPAEVPGDVAYVALLVRDGSGMITSASPIAFWPKGEGLPIYAPADGELIIAGWSREALARASGGGDVDGAIAGGELELAAGCDPVLPKAEWTARWTPDERIETLEELALPPLTARWLRDRCEPADDSRFAIDVGCRDRRCEIVRRRVSACSVDLDLSPCGFGVVHATMHADGRLCASFADVGLACDAPVEYGLQSVEASCAAEGPICPIRAEVAPREPPWIATRIALFPVAPFVPRWLTYSEALRPKTPLFGYGRDLVVLEDRVIVASSLDPLPCPAGQSTSRFDVLDLDGTQTATRAAPACISRVARDLNGDGFVAFYTDRDRWSLGRFSANGALSSSVSVDGSLDPGVDPPRVTARDWAPLAFEDSPSAGELYALFGPSEYLGGEDGAKLLIVFDGRTLAQLRRTPITHGKCWTLAVLGADRLATACTDLRELVFIGQPSGVEEDSIVLPRQDSGGRDSLLEVAFHAPSGRLITAASRSPFAFVAGAETRTLEGHALMFERDATPVRSVTWPLDQAKVFVSAIGRAPDASWVALGALFDPMHVHFEAGTFELGPGIPSRIRIDANGTLWILLPWSAEVVRLVPRGAP